MSKTSEEGNSSSQPGGPSQGGAGGFSITGIFPTQQHSDSYPCSSPSLRGYEWSGGYSSISCIECDINSRTHAYQNSGGRIRFQAFRRLLLRCTDVPVSVYLILLTPQLNFHKEAIRKLGKKGQWQPLHIYGFHCFSSIDQMRKQLGHDPWKTCCQYLPDNL